MVHSRDLRPAPHSSIPSKSSLDEYSRLRLIYDPRMARLLSALSLVANICTYNIVSAMLPELVCEPSGLPARLFNPLLILKQVSATHLWSCLKEKGVLCPTCARSRGRRHMISSWPVDVVCRLMGCWWMGDGEDVICRQPTTSGMKVQLQRRAFSWGLIKMLGSGMITPAAGQEASSREEAARQVTLPSLLDETLLCRAMPPLHMSEFSFLGFHTVPGCHRA